MARRGTNFNRRADKQLHGDAVSATTFVLRPSGTTIGATITSPSFAGKSDWGQGQYNVVRGESGVSGPNGALYTGLSAGTIQIHCGPLTNVLSFQFTPVILSGLTTASTGWTAFRNTKFTVQLGYAGGAGVTIQVLDGSDSAVTGAASLIIDNPGGTSLSWIAIGT